MAILITEKQRNGFLDRCAAGVNGCIIFTGPYRGNGYGATCYRRDGKMMACNAHQFAFVLWGGDLSDGLVVRHTCDNQRCVNPKHLISGTPKDNTRDMMLRGRRVAAQKLSAENIRDIQVMLSSGVPQPIIAKQFGICQQRVSQINRGKGLTQILERTR